jgi:hypothetical protein
VRAMKEGKLYTTAGAARATAGAARAPGGKSNIVRNFYLWCLVAIFSILRFSAKISRSRKKSRFLLDRMDEETNEW